MPQFLVYSFSTHPSQSQNILTYNACLRFPLEAPPNFTFKKPIRGEVNIVQESISVIGALKRILGIINDERSSLEKIPYSC